MKKLSSIGLAMILAASSAQAAVVSAGNSGSGWLGFMNVFELPSNGGGFVFPSGWGVADLATSFDDGAETLTLLPNSINDPNPFWYTPAGGPGSSGNKIMEANLYYETTGVYVGQTVTFEGTVLSTSFTSAHTAIIFIKDFAPDFSSVVTTEIPLVAGAFSLSLNTINDPARYVQWGFQVKGVNVWSTDIAPFGNAVISTRVIPQPGALAMLAVGGLVATRRRRS